MMKPSWKVLKTVGGLIGIFAVLAIAAGITKAALATLSIVVAYGFEFYVFRTAVRLATLQKVKLATLLLCGLTITAGAILVYLHWANMLGTVIVCLFAMDAILLRFRYSPNV